MTRLLPLLLAALLPWPALAAPPVVVADIAPVAALVDGVMAGLAHAEALLPAGGDPHHFQLRSSQARALADAGLVVWVGPDLTPSLSAALPRLAPDAPALVLAEAPGVTARAPMFSTDETTDPHLWLDPENQRAMVRAIAGELARLDPGNAGRYAANAARVVDGIDADEARARAILGPLRGRRLVVAHDAYAHLAAAFGLAIVASVADGEATEPGARHLRALREMIAAGGADCLLLETTHPSKAAERLGADTAIATGRVDPLGAGKAPGAFFTDLARGIDACGARAAP